MAKRLTFIAVFTLPTVQTDLLSSLLAGIVSKGVIACPAECGTVLSVVVRVAANAKANGHHSAVLGVEGAHLPVEGRHCKLVLHHETVHSTVGH